MRNKETIKLVYAALYVAIAAFLKINSLQLTDSLRISLFAIPILLSGYFLGPVYGLMVGFATDTVYMVISPFASFWSIYTISTMMWGLAGALIKKFKISPEVLSFIIVISITTILETTINSIPTYLRYRDLYTVLTERLISVYVMLGRLPILITITFMLTKKLKYQELNFNEWIHFQYIQSWIL